jgi:hypothetical protein
MAVLLFSVLSYVVLSYPATPSSASANLVGVIDDDYLMIEHRGGESLNLDTRVVLTISGSIPKSVSVGDKIIQHKIKLRIKALPFLEAK